MTIKSLFRFEKLNKGDLDFSQRQIFSFVCPLKYHVIFAFIPSILKRVQRWRVSWIRSIHSLLCQKGRCIQLFRERLSEKSARDNLERHCGWFWVLCFSKKFERIGTKGYGTLFASAKGKQQKKVRQLQSSGTVYLLYPILPFRDCRVHIFSDNLSRNTCKPILGKRPLWFNARLLEIKFNSTFTRQSTIRAQFLSTRR